MSPGSLVSTRSAGATRSAACASTTSAEPALPSSTPISLPLPLLNGSTPTPASTRARLTCVRLHLARPDRPPPHSSGPVRPAAGAPAAGRPSYGPRRSTATSAPASSTAFTPRPDEPAAQAVRPPRQSSASVKEPSSASQASSAVPRSSFLSRSAAALTDSQSRHAGPLPPARSSGGLPSPSSGGIVTENPIYLRHAYDHIAYRSMHKMAHDHHEFRQLLSVGRRQPRTAGMKLCRGVGSTTRGGRTWR